jgi:membrane associated rhomboid family serine protease
MSRHPYQSGGRSIFGFGLGGAVLLLLAWNVIAYLLQQVVPLRVPLPPELGHGLINGLTYYLGLRPWAIWHEGWVWQLVTYMFLHGSFTHILFNMLALWMFGSQIEGDWGTPEFVRYYFFTGIGAGIITALVFPNEFFPTVGASGAIFGLLLAYGVSYPDRPIFLYFLFPIPAKFFVIIFGVIELLAGFTALTRGGSRIAHFAHLGGIVFGLLYLWMWGFPGGRLGWMRRRKIARRRASYRVIDFQDPQDRNRW